MALPRLFTWSLSTEKYKFGVSPKTPPAPPLSAASRMENAEATRALALGTQGSKRVPKEDRFTPLVT